MQAGGRMRKSIVSFVLGTVFGAIVSGLIVYFIMDAQVEKELLRRQQVEQDSIRARQQMFQLQKVARERAQMEAKARKSALKQIADLQRQLAAARKEKGE